MPKPLRLRFRTHRSACRCPHPSCQSAPAPLIGSGRDQRLADTGARRSARLAARVHVEVALHAQDGFSSPISECLNDNPSHSPARVSRANRHHPTHINCMSVGMGTAGDPMPGLLAMQYLLVSSATAKRSGTPALRFIRLFLARAASATFPRGSTVVRSVIEACVSTHAGPCGYATRSYASHRFQSELQRGRTGRPRQAVFVNAARWSG